jgi:acetolactate synthase-1/2/3 large subunit
VIWEDKEYGLIKWKQDNEFGTHTDLAFDNPDFVKLAESFDCFGIRVENSRDLKPALEEAFQCGRPALIAIPIDYRENSILSQKLGNIQCPI